LKLSSPKQFQQVLVLTNNESEKMQYVNMLADLSDKVKTLKQNSCAVGTMFGTIGRARHPFVCRSQRTSQFLAKELFDVSRSSSLKETTAAVILGRTTFTVTSTGDSLFSVQMLIGFSCVATMVSFCSTSAKTVN
jgi:hypothetical protein